MSDLFADSAFYIAAVNPRDGLHGMATAFLENLEGRLVTTDFVLVEVGNWLSKSRDRAVFVELVQRLRADANSTIVEANRAIFDAGFDLYSQRPDKDWSLTDCISFVVMNRLRLTEALTADRHFEQAGFKVLLK
jgi:predicted nucleic acid-binding protein